MVHASNRMPFPPQFMNEDDDEYGGKNDLLFWGRHDPIEAISTEAKNGAHMGVVVPKNRFLAQQRPKSVLVAVCRGNTAISPQLCSVIA